MKNLILFLSLFLFTQTIIAQEEIKQNKFVVGGSFNLSIQNNGYPYSSLTSFSANGSIVGSSIDDFTNTTFSTTPYIGYVLNEHLLLGLQINYGYGKLSSNRSSGIVFSSTRTTNQFNFGIFARYVINPENKLKLYAQPFVSYNILNENFVSEILDPSFSSTIQTFTDYRKVNLLDLGISTGFLYDFNKKWRLVTGMGLINYVNGSWKYENREPNNFNSFNTNFSLASIRLGAEFKF